MIFGSTRRIAITLCLCTVFGQTSWIFQKNKTVLECHNLLLITYLWPAQSMRRARNYSDLISFDPAQVLQPNLLYLRPRCKTHLPVPQAGPLAHPRALCFHLTPSLDKVLVV